MTISKIKLCPLCGEHDEVATFGLRSKCDQIKESTYERSYCKKCKSRTDAAKQRLARVVLKKFMDASTYYQVCDIQKYFAETTKEIMKRVVPKKVPQGRKKKYVRVADRLSV